MATGCLRTGDNPRQCFATTFAGDARDLELMTQLTSPSIRLPHCRALSRSRLLRVVHEITRMCKSRPPRFLRTLTDVPIQPQKHAARPRLICKTWFERSALAVVLHSRIHIPKKKEKKKKKKKKKKKMKTMAVFAPSPLLRVESPQRGQMLMRTVFSAVPGKWWLMKN